MKTRENIGIPDIEHCSQRQLARVYGLSYQAVQKWDCPRNDDGTYSLSAVVKWREECLAADTELCGGGSDSPALEQYRAAKARLAELDLQERTKNLVDRAHTVKCMMEFGAVIRSCGADLERKHGAAARERLDQAIDAAVAAVKKMLGENEPNA